MKENSAQNCPTLIVGWREHIGLPQLHIGDIVAKVDTGARTSAFHASGIEVYTAGGESRVRFLRRDVPLEAAQEPDWCDLPLLEIRDITNTSGVPESRPVVRTPMVLNGRRWQIDVSLANRRGMKHTVILGRQAIRGHRILVNPGKSFLAS